MPAEIIMNCTMDYNSLQEAGSSFGTGAVMVMDDSTCMVRVLRPYIAFLHGGILRPVHALS